MANHRFTGEDLQQMAALGIAPEEAARHIELLRNPPPYSYVLRPCRLGDGIRAIQPEEEGKLLARFETARLAGRVSKLVPASGAASRMFKALTAELERLEHGDESPPSGDAEIFFSQLPRFPFSVELAAAVERGGTRLGTDTKSSARARHAVLRHLLTSEGLGYSDCPKGLVLFHRYATGARTPFEEHLVEAADYGRDDEGRCRLHFTVPSHYEAAFRSLLERAGPPLEETFACRFEVDFSHQRRATDTLAVDLEHRPFRLADGSLLFRPGGHGALIHNLQQLAHAGAGIVLIKNIDNVVPDRTKPLVSRWKRLLTGLLCELEERIGDLMCRLAAGTEGSAAAAESFLANELGRPQPLARHGSEARRQQLLAALDRPLRVCGVVCNTGEPGGGPFWVRSREGEVSLQIVETSQIDPDSQEQQSKVGQATHFSPVDISCSLRDCQGRPFDLHRFVDPGTVFVSEKSHEGRPLKALERPGLWNGAMAGWNTVFVEVPDATFAPVKTVLDLLRPEHQP
jgi:hypothetical protein